MMFTMTSEWEKEWWDGEENSWYHITLSNQGRIYPGFAHGRFLTISACIACGALYKTPPMLAVGAWCNRSDGSGSG